jgi:hypothetical protein
MFPFRIKGSCVGASRSLGRRGPDDSAAKSAGETSLSGDLSKSLGGEHLPRPLACVPDRRLHLRAERIGVDGEHVAKERFADPLGVDHAVAVGAGHPSDQHGIASVEHDAPIPLALDAVAGPRHAGHIAGAVERAPCQLGGGLRLLVAGTAALVDRTRPS